jgi:hypothetical protein
MSTALAFQLSGTACLIMVALTHVCEAHHLFPWMGWGLKHSVGHYLDLSSAILALTLLTLGFILQRRWASPPRSLAVPRQRGSDSGSVLPFSRPLSRERTLKIHCDSCQARFVARHGTEEDADTQTIDVEKCGLSGGDTFKKDNIKGATLRLMAQVTAREIKHGWEALSPTRIDPAGNTREREHPVGFRS